MAAIGEAEDRAQRWDVTRLAGALGGEVRGVDLAHVDAADLAAIEALLLEHLVLFFPEIHLTKDATY